MKCLIRGSETEIQIREYTTKDFKKFAMLYAKIFAEPPWLEIWTPSLVGEEVAGYFKQERLNFLLAKVNKQTQQQSKEVIVGFSIAYYVKPTFFPKELANLLRRIGLPAIYGDELAVDKEFRNLGIGTMLMQNRFEFFRSILNKSCIFVGRTDSKSKMVGLYKSLGYRNTGVTAEKYPNRYYFIREMECK